VGGYTHDKLAVLGGWLLRLKVVAAEVRRAEPLLPPHRCVETATLAGRLEQLYGRLNGKAVAMVVRAGPRRRRKR